MDGGPSTPMRKRAQSMVQWAEGERDSLEPVRGSGEFIENGLIELELGDGIGIGRIVLGALIESEVGLGGPRAGATGGGRGEMPR